MIQKLHVSETRRAWRFFPACAAVLTLVACDAPETTQPAQVLEFSALAGRFPSKSPPVVIPAGDSLNGVIASQLAHHVQSEGIPLSWSSADPSVASVSAQGVVRGLRSGSTRIVVAVRRLRDTIPVTVTSRVASAVVTASRTSFGVGQASQLTVVATDKNGAVISNPSLGFTSSNASVATVDASGRVSGVAAGTVVIRVTAGPASTTIVLSVTGGAAPPPPPPPAGGPVALPAPPQLLNFTYPRVTGQTWTVGNGGNLQQALNQAQRGDEIVIAAGATFTGTFTLPNKAGSAANGWILVRSDRSSQLPPQGVRVTPADAGAMPKLVTATVYPVLDTAPGASGWWISGLELTMSTTLTHINYGLVLLGDGSSSQTQLSQVPSDIVLDRVYVHAHPNTLTSRCIALNSARSAVQDSYVHECHLKGFDSQAIAGWNGPGPFKIVNNTLAGAGENIMFGGSDPRIPNLIPSDIEIRRNYIHTPASWAGRWTKKNLIESKNMQRVLIEANVLDGSWVDGQVGYAVLLKSVNQSGRCTWCTTRDVTIRRNVVRNAGAGFNLAGREGSNRNAVGEVLSRVLIEQNIVENIMVGSYKGDAKFIQLLKNLTDLTVRDNTMSTTGNVKMFLSLGNAPAATNVDFHNNIFSYGGYGLFSSKHASGFKSMQNIQGTALFNNHVLIGPAKNGYPYSSFVPSLGAALQTSAGANMAATAAATSGVVIP
ncbi:MAG: Ig-like domain-containing protein [Gemmatimonadaceae bacterium]